MEEILQLKPSMATIEDKGGAMPLMFASNKGHKKVRNRLGRICMCVCVHIGV